VGLRPGVFDARIEMARNRASAGMRKKHALQLFKTDMCKFFLRNKCDNGDSCSYAHSVDEVRPKPDLTATSMCRSMLQTGSCTNSSCRFAHSEAELRATHGFFKMKLCNFAQSGRCKHGAACRFAHSVDELRPARPPPPPGGEDATLAARQEQLRQFAHQSEVSVPAPPPRRTIAPLDSQSRVGGGASCSSSGEAATASSSQAAGLAPRPLGHHSFAFNSGRAAPQGGGACRVSHRKHGGAAGTIVGGGSGSSEGEREDWACSSWTSGTSGNTEVPFSEHTGPGSANTASMSDGSGGGCGCSSSTATRGASTSEGLGRSSDSRGAQTHATQQQQQQQQPSRQQSQQPSQQQQQQQPSQQHKKQPQPQQQSLQQQHQQQHSQVQQPQQQQHDQRSMHHQMRAGQQQQAEQLPQQQQLKQQKPQSQPPQPQQPPHQQHFRQQLPQSRRKVGGNADVALPPKVTTLLVTNIPSYLTQGAALSLFEDLDPGMRGKFDFFFCPWDEQLGQNLGYAILNFPEVEQAAAFQQAWSNKAFCRGLRTQKNLKVMKAALQGREANSEYCSRIQITACSDSRFRPLVRDIAGMLRPLALDGDMEAPLPLASSSSPEMPPGGAIAGASAGSHAADQQAEAAVPPSQWPMVTEQVASTARLDQTRNDPPDIGPSVGRLERDGVQANALHRNQVQCGHPVVSYMMMPMEVVSIDGNFASAPQSCSLGPGVITPAGANWVVNPRNATGQWGEEDEVYSD